jgi:regulator of sigma E protease
MEELAGKPIVLRVTREKEGHKATVDILVQQAYHWVLGLRMRMGAIAAVRDGSPAAKAGILPGDVISRIEVKNAQGVIMRVLTSESTRSNKPEVIEEDLDPVRLPWQLSQNIGNTASPIVSLKVVRTNPASGETHTERQEFTLTARWDPSWRFNQEMPVTPASPMSIPELGLAYLVETRIEAVAPKSAASHAVVIDPVSIKFQKGDQIQRNGKSLNGAEGEAIDLQPGDQISLRPFNVVKAIRFMKPREHSSDKIVPDKNWQSIKSDQWAYFFNILQMELDSKDVDLQVERDGQTLNVRLAAQQDKGWPLADRGIPLIYDTRLQKAATLAQAMSMGLNETWDFITQIYQNLEGLITRRVSADMFGGPIMIAHIAYKIAGHDYYRLISFLGIISVNLAVINFLPIPVLDGGHMVFLLYEKLRGRPAPKRFQEAATYIGLALIFCLLVAVVFHDFLNLRRM